jgi:hypothetical protein
MRTLSLFLVNLVGQTVLGHGDHGDHGQKPMVDENASWMAKHMAGMAYLRAVTQAGTAADNSV